MNEHISHSQVSHRHAPERPSPDAARGLGGNSISRIVHEHCATPRLHLWAGAVIEHLDTQIGTWQCSLDDGETWRSVRTDLINRDGNTGLALDRDARLRVLPFAGHRVESARIALHVVALAHGASNGCYRPYADEDRDAGSETITLVLGLEAINGKPPVVKASRPRNKRALLARGGTSGRAVGRPFAMA